MTTKVTVTTHTWPVDVTTTDRYGRTLHSEVATVEPNSSRDFYLTSSRSIQFDELPAPIQDAEFTEVDDAAV